MKKFILFIFLSYYAHGYQELYPLYDNAKPCLKNHPKVDILLNKLVKNNSVSITNNADLQQIQAAIEDYISSLQEDVNYYYIGNSLPAPMCLIGLPTPSKDGCTWKLYRRVSLNKIMANKKYQIITSLTGTDKRLTNNKYCLNTLKSEKKIIPTPSSKLPLKESGEFYLFSIDKKQFLISVTKPKKSYLVQITDDQKKIRRFLMSLNFED